MLPFKRQIATLLILVVSAIFCLPLSAHRHQRDTVIVNGALCTIGNHPLGQLDSLHYVALADALDFRKSISSWNWNGHLDTFEVDGDRLYLTQIMTFDDGKRFYDPKDYLEDFVDQSGRVFASWYSGELECAKGEILFYDIDGLHDICESTIKLTVKSGVVAGRQEFVNIKHSGKNKIQDISKDLEAFPRDKFSQLAMVFVCPTPKKTASDGTVKEWSFELHSKVELTPKTEKELVRELNKMLLKYDFDTYRDCGIWILSPRNISFRVGIGKLHP